MRAERIHDPRPHPLITEIHAGAYEGDAVTGMNFGNEGGGDVGHDLALPARITSRTPMPILRYMGG